jgi:hypothetical protein
VWGGVIKMAWEEVGVEKKKEKKLHMKKIVE